MERSDPTRDVWIELWTVNERIEGIVRVPNGSPCRRIADLVWHADRGASGLLHLAQAAVYDLNTGKVKFRKQALGVNRQMVLFAAPLNPSPADPPADDITTIRISKN